jgi:hypothetical protein
MASLESMSLWRRTLAAQGDPLDAQREVLRQAFLGFRERVGELVQTLGAELPGLTVHDITHLDALWRVADQIAGPNYPVNPAEAFVLGGAFLLHDAAHVMAAYSGGISSIKETVQWQDLIAQRYGGREPEARSNEERLALFQVLRHLHAEQAHRLARLEWTVPNAGPKLHLLEHLELREYYADLIGEIAASHHWPAHRVAEIFHNRRVSAAASLQPADWEVDALKLAFLLRTADAAHIDGLRAPWFLFALRQPEGISEDHWRFQAKLGQPTRTPEGELRITSGSQFSHAERKAWWLAYDTACMIDRELRDAHALMRDERRPCFAVICVLGSETPEAFAQQVRVRDWEPVNVAPKITDVPKVIAELGGSKLYGDEPWIALRELLQNALDAVRALRALGYLKDTEGEVEVRTEPAGGDDWWLHVTDTGIGMSRHVLTNVLLDFGNSLWRSDALRDELPGLVRSGFDAVGQFGIGFYSVFMLGSQVRVTTRRFERSERDDSDQWLLAFEDGLEGRPMLMQAQGRDRLQRHGTQVSVKLTADRLALMFQLTILPSIGFHFAQRFETPGADAVLRGGSELLPALVGWLCPASEVSLYARFADAPTVAVVAPDDWIHLGQEVLIRRVQCEDAHLVPLRDESGALIGRVGLARHFRGAAVVLHGVCCGYLQDLSGLVLARENNQDARRTEASVAGSTAAWSRWAAQVWAGQSDLEIELLLKLHPLLPDHDLPVWRAGVHAVKLDDLVARIVASDELRVHLGEVSHEDYDDVGRDRFHAGFELSDDVVIMPGFPPDFMQLVARDRFPYLLGVMPIDYQSRLEAELARHWSGFEEYEEDDALVGEVDGIEIRRPVTVYRRVGTR